LGKRRYSILTFLILVLSTAIIGLNRAYADEEVFPEIPRHPLPPIDRGGIVPAFMSLVFGPGTGERVNEGIELKPEETWIRLIPVLGQLVWISNVMDAGNGGTYTEMYSGSPPEVRPEGGLFPLLVSLIVGIGGGQRYNEGYDLTAKEWLTLTGGGVIAVLWSTFDAYNGKTYSEEVRRRR
jgi:hypothetical protein